MAMTTERTPHRALPSVLYGVGLLAVYLGERVIEVGKTSTAVTVIGVLLVLAGFGSRLYAAQTASPRSRPAERWLLGLTALGIVALALYFLNSTLTFQLTGRTFEAKYPRLSGIVACLWPALLAVASLPILFGELSLATMKRAAVLDLGRVRAAIASAMGLSFALIFSFAIAYVAAERDVKVDLSYFRMARAGEATKKLVRALDKPVRIYLFYPPGNEVREEIESYFGDLTRESKQITVESYDHALNMAKARELGVSGNGIIVVSRDSLREQIATPLQLEAARSQLKVLDQEVHKRIIGVSRPNRVAYFVQGHEERTFEPMGETDQRATIRLLKDLLVDMGYQPKDLGIAQGLGTDVPSDAGIVLLIGPRKPLLKEEVATLGRYLDRKGRLFVALDPEAGLPMEELLGAVGLKYTPVTLANDKFYLNRTYQHADRINVATGSYSSHASVSTIGRYGIRAPVIFIGVGSLQKAAKMPPGLVNVDFTVHADAATWNDVNGNFEHDTASEARMPYELAAAVTKRSPSAITMEDEARAVVLADSDAVSDTLIGRSLGNTYLVRDAVRWLGGEEAITGTVNNEEDVAVAHTRRQDLAWFYSSVFAVPALVLTAGFVMTRRRKSGRTNGPSRPSAGPPPHAPDAEASKASTEVVS